MAAFLASALPTLPARVVLGDLVSPFFFKPFGSEVRRGIRDLPGEFRTGESLDSDAVMADDEVFLASNEMVDLISE